MFVFSFLFLAFGKDVKANVESPLEQQPMHAGRNTV